MTIETWLDDATRKLSKDSAARVRREIGEHYESARDAALRAGATADEAERSALRDLGDAKRVNCDYRQVMLTSAEARLLKEGNWELRAVCSRPWMKRVAMLTPFAALLLAAALWLGGKQWEARALLIAGIGMAPALVGPFLPVYTRRRGLVYRIMKWIGMAGAMLLIFGSDALNWSWLLVSSLGPLAVTEWMRASIRRKLPVADWPKQLYL